MTNGHTPPGADAAPRRRLDREAYERRAREGPRFVCETLVGNPEYRAHLVWADDDAVAFLARSRRCSAPRWSPHGPTGSR